MIDNLSSKYTRTGDGCWNWLGTKNQFGYGRVRVNGKKYVVAHRVVYEALVGSIPEGLTLDHLCRNRACVNPTHLEPVTMRINTLRGISPSANHARKTECSNGHPFADDNLEVRSNGSRRCRACQKEFGKLYMRRKRAALKGQK